MRARVPIDVAGRIRPTREQQADIAFGWPLLNELAGLEAAQALAVREGDVIAVCCAEGLEAMIERSGRLCRKRGWTLLVARPPSDGAGSPPGLETVRRLGAAHGGCLALGVGIELDEHLVQAADGAKIAVVRVGDCPPGA